MPRRSALVLLAASLAVPVTAVTAVTALTAATAPARAADGSPAAPGSAGRALGSLTPATLVTAYDLGGLHARGITGKGVTIGIVDSFGSPTIREDLTTYSRRFGLPLPTADSFQVVNPAGPNPPFDPTDSDMAGWAGETTLDVEVAHAVAPDATIVLIETPTSETEGLAGFPEIIAAENAVLSGHTASGAAVPRVDLLSQSFAATEQTFTGADQVRGLSQQVYPAAKAAGVTVLSSSGDNGPVDYQLDQKTLYDTPVTDWPASDPLVTAVGGTTLDLAADGSRQGPDAAWGGRSAAGGGLSTVFPRPAFQASVAGVATTGRAVPDVSLDADPFSGVQIYSSYDGPGGYTIGGGTSQASPIMAGIVALADQLAGGRVGYLNDVLYGTLAHAADGGIVDVTHGSNDCSCTKVPGYQAVGGYDLASGLGTIDGGKFVPALVAATKGQTQPLAASGAPATAAGSASSSAPSSPSTIPSPTASSPATRPTAASHHDSGGSKAVLGTVAGLLVVLVAAGGALAYRRRGRRPAA